MTTADLSTMNEAELAKADEPSPKTIEELTEIIRSLVERGHDYGTCVYAMSLSAVAAFNFVAHKLGVTGFQASCADLDILRHTRRLTWGKVLNFENLLYPQYLDEEHYPSCQHLLHEHREELAKRAGVLLTERANGGASKNVVDHWKWLVEQGSTAAGGA